MKLKLEKGAFQKILKISVVLMFILLIKSTLVGLVFGSGLLHNGSPQYKITWLFIVISFYLQSFVLLIIFSLIRKRIVLSNFKAGAIYGLMIWFVTSGLFLLINLMSYLSPDVRDRMYDPYYSIEAQVIEIIFKLVVSSVSSMAVGVIISFIHSKYIAKNN